MALWDENKHIDSPQILSSPSQMAADYLHYSIDVLGQKLHLLWEKWLKKDGDGTRKSGIGRALVSLASLDPHVPVAIMMSQFLTAAMRQWWDEFGFHLMDTTGF
eukprot:15328037-Ditylum_brightwellii.AAC.1